jgi:peptide chain release factor subunit 1
MFAIDSSAVHTLIIFENLEMSRFVLKHPSGTNRVLFLTPQQETCAKYFKDAETNQDLEISEKVPIVEWFAENYKTMGLSLQLVTDNSQEGSQFVKGFGGIGCLLRFKVDFSTLDAEEELEKKANKVGEDSSSDYQDDEDYDYIY